MQLASKEKFIIGCAYRHPLQDYNMFAEAFRGTICNPKLYQIGNSNIDYAEFNFNSKKKTTHII